MRAIQDTTPEIGKISQRTFERVIQPALGRPRSDVLVGPQTGVDVGIIDLGGDRVLALTTDPFFVDPAYGWERAGWFAVQIAASDAATAGLAPAYCTIDLNLPPTMTDGKLEALWSSVAATSDSLGMAVVTGHTGRYEGCDYPMLGAITVAAIGERSRYLTPAMAQPGDAVVITKGAAIEATAVFGVVFPTIIESAYGTEIARAATALFSQLSVVDDALTAVGIGVRGDGVTGMHDATEGGVLGAVWEMAHASGNGIVVDQAAIPVRAEVRAVCDLFAMDPYAASSEGTLILTCRPHRASALLEHLEDAGIPAARIGEIVPPAEGATISANGHTRVLEVPPPDPFWPAYTRARAEFEQ